MKDQKSKKSTLILLSLLGLLLFFGCWELLVRVGVISERSLCAPSTAVSTFIFKLSNKKPDGATLIAHFVSSMKLSLTGFVLAVVIGVPLGLFMGYYKVLDSFFTPLFEIIRPIPPIAWIPIIILTLGIGFRAKVFIIFISAFVPCVVNSYLGVKPLADLPPRLYSFFNEHGFHRHPDFSRQLVVHAGCGRNACIHQRSWLYDSNRTKPDPSGYHHCRHADDRSDGRTDGMDLESV